MKKRHRRVSRRPRSSSLVSSCQRATSKEKKSGERLKGRRWETCRPFLRWRLHWKHRKTKVCIQIFFKTSLELESLFAIVWKSSKKFRFLVFLRAKLAPPKASQMRVISNHNSNQVEWIVKVDASFQFWSLWISCWKCISWASELCSILLIRTEKNDYTYHRKKLLEHDNGDFESILWPSDIEAFKGLFQCIT